MHAGGSTAWAMVLGGEVLLLEVTLALDAAVILHNVEAHEAWARARNGAYKFHRGMAVVDVASRPLAAITVTGFLLVLVTFILADTTVLLGLALLLVFHVRLWWLNMHTVDYLALPCRLRTTSSWLATVHRYRSCYHQAHCDSIDQVKEDAATTTPEHMAVRGQWSHGQEDLAHAAQSKTEQRHEKASEQLYNSGTTYTNAEGQYTYTTDENGYAWMYDNLYGQYYYYDASQGLYVPYIAADTGGTTGAIVGGSATVSATTATSEGIECSKTEKTKHPKQQRIVWMAGGQVWEDSKLDEWPTDDYRLFAGDLGPEVTDEVLQQSFGKFRSLQRVQVICEKATGKSRGYGFLSFGNADDFFAAWKEFNGKYVGSHPIKLCKSTWKDRNADIRKVKRHDKRAFLDYKQCK
ncbi:hypothetical protein IW136_001962 [Coemansia sp. RSA 678]|nr:hypothetical protein IW136_001962 [Coemansia sp. RSA 678]